MVFSPRRETLYEVLLLRVVALGYTQGKGRDVMQVLFIPVVLEGRVRGLGEIIEDHGREPEPLRRG